MDNLTLTREMRVIHLPKETRDIPVVSPKYLHDTSHSLQYRFIKRTIDIVASFMGIILLSPLFLILSLAVKFTSPGKVIFKDKRIGKNGKIISVYKFRTMYKNSEDVLLTKLTEEQLEQWTKERKIDNDPRVTKVGKFLRKTSLDELPQLVNILFGSMTLVGPRAITDRELHDNYSEEEQNVLLSVTPGLTGYWQTYGRSDVTFESGKRQEMDLYYVYNRSLKLDIKLLFLTIPAVLKNKGAK